MGDERMEGNRTMHIQVLDSQSRDVTLSSFLPKSPSLVRSPLTVSSKHPMHATPSAREEKIKKSICRVNEKRDKKHGEKRGEPVKVKRSRKTTDAKECRVGLTLDSIRYGVGWGLYEV